MLGKSIPKLPGFTAWGDVMNMGLNGNMDTLACLQSKTLKTMLSFAVIDSKQFDYLIRFYNIGI